MLNRKVILLIFILSFSLSIYAVDVYKSTGPADLKIEPVDPTIAEIKFPYIKYSKVSSIKLELSKIHQDLSSQNLLEMSNEKNMTDPAEEIKGKTWVAQEIIALKSFELNRVEIKMERPLEEGLELIVCDANLFEKTRGAIKYDSDKKGCFAELEPSIQIQDKEHFFLAVKLAETPIFAGKSLDEGLFAFYTDYPDGFKERDPFPEYLNKGLIKTTESLIYSLYSIKALDIKPLFHVKLKESFDPFWTWDGKESGSAGGKDFAEALNLHIKENKNSFEYDKEVKIPITFLAESSKYPILLKLKAWEIEIKGTSDYISEIKGSINQIFEKDESARVGFVNQLNEIADSFRDEKFDELNEKIKLLMENLYSERSELGSDKEGASKDIDNVMELAKEMQNLFAEN